MNRGEIDPSSLAEDSSWTQFQIASFRSDSAGKVINWSKVGSVALCTESETASAKFRVRQSKQQRPGKALRDFHPTN
jgi:hypothetical protein